MFEKLKQLDSEMIEFIQEEFFESEDNISQFNETIELMNKFLMSGKDEELNITWGQRFEVYSDILQLYNDKPYFLEKLDIFLENLNNKSTENLTVDLYGMDYFIFPHTEEHYTNNILLRQKTNNFKNAYDYKTLIDFLKNLINSSENNQSIAFYCYIDKETKEFVIKKENEQETLSQTNIRGDSHNIFPFLDRIGGIFYNRKQQQEQNFLKNKTSDDKSLFISSLKSLFEKSIIQDVLPTTNNLTNNKKRL